MAMETNKPARSSSRRRALAVLLGGWRLMPEALAAGDTGPPVRFAISESLVATNVNINDARVATRLWIDRVRLEVNATIDPKMFSTSQEIVDRCRRNELDMIVLNALEYRQIANLLDPSQIVTATSEDGQERYLILAKRNSPIRSLADLKGRRLIVLKNPKMCLGAAWLEGVLDEAHFGPPEQFFGSIATETKCSKVVLPVFFGQADACLTSKAGFATMCELNPQVGKELAVVATSPTVITGFYIFRKDSPDAQKQKIVRAIANLRNGPGGQELAALFQFNGLTVRGPESLATALNILDAADRARARELAGGRK
jgi:phosphonate transport system substrate-binding protein